MRPIDAGDLMTMPLVTLRTWHTMQRAARTLLEHEISGAPVLDHNDQPVGVLTKTDVLRYESQYAAPAVQELRNVARETGTMPEHEREEDYVGYWMTRGVVSVSPETTIEEVARLMARRHLHRVFVEDGERLVGVITAFDLLRAVGGAPGTFQTRRPARIIRGRARARARGRVKAP